MDRPRTFSVFADREAVWTTILAAKASLGQKIRPFGNPNRIPVVGQEHTGIIDALDAGNDDEAEQLEYCIDKIFRMIYQLPNRYRLYVMD